MPLYEFECPECGEIREEIVYGNQAVVCKHCQVIMEKLFPKSVKIRWGNGFIGSVKPHDYGKVDKKTVFYPDGRHRERRWNDLYEDGILGVTK